MKRILLVLTYAFLLLTNYVNAQNNDFIIGGGPGELKILIFNDGTYIVERESVPGSGVWENQFYADEEIFAIRIGSKTYTPTRRFTYGDDIINIDGTREEYTKIYFGTHIPFAPITGPRYPFTVTIKTIYDRSNPDYFVMEATIDADSIPLSDSISFGYGYDSYVNDCDGGAAWILPDLSGYNGVDVERNLTDAEVASLQFVGGINDRGAGSLMGFFPVGLSFDRAYSAYYGNSYASRIVKTTLNNLFKFGPPSVPTCNAMQPWDNGVGVVYDNIPSGQTTIINTGLTFTRDIDGTLDYKWDNLKDKTTSVGSINILNLEYTSLSTSLLNGIAFRTNFPGLEINSSCTMTGWLGGTSDCAIGNNYYKLNNASISGGAIANIDIPIIVKQYGQWEVNANSISETAKTLPTGTPAILTAPTSINISTISSDSICNGSSSTITIKLDGTETTSQDIIINLDYTGSTATTSDCSILPTTITILANTNSTTFSIASTNLTTNELKVNFSLHSTNKAFATIGTTNSCEIVLKAKPVINVSDVSICTGSTATLTVNLPIVGATYNWYSGTTLLHSGTSFTTPTLSATTTYQVEIIKGGCTNTKTVTVIVDDIPTLDVSEVSICTGSTATLTVNLSIIGATYNWYSGITLLHTGTSFTTPILNATTTYQVEVIKSNCSKVKPVIVTVDNVPIIDVSEVSICTGSTATLTVNSPIVGATYNWYSGITLLHTGTSFTTPTLSATTTYQVEIIKGSCTNTKEIMVTVDNAPIIDVSEVSICTGSTATLTVNSPIAGATYNWYSGTTLLHTGTSFTTPTLSTTTTYQVEIIKGSCTNTRDIIVTINNTSTIDIDDVSICSGTSTTLSVVNPIAGAIYNWYLESTLLHSGTSFTTPELTATTNYQVEMIDVCNNLKEIVVTVTTLVINPNILPFYKIGEPYNYQLEANANQAIFSVSEGSLPMGLNLYNSGKLEGTVSSDFGKEYEFTVKVMDITNGCIGLKEYMIKSNFFVPEVFSPNGDGINDYFMKGYKVIIYDRLGVKLFEGNDGWDGTYKNKQMKPDTYFYVLYHINVMGKEERLTGYIMLLKH